MIKIPIHFTRVIGLEKIEGFNNLSLKMCFDDEDFSFEGNTSPLSRYFERLYPPSMKSVYIWELNSVGITDELLRILVHNGMHEEGFEMNIVIEFQFEIIQSFNPDQLNLFE